MLERAIWLFENWANDSLNWFWFGKALRKIGYEPTGQRTVI
jgi:hypothetical protein